MLKDFFHSKEVFNRMDDYNVSSKLNFYIRKLAADNGIELNWPVSSTLVKVTHPNTFVLMGGISFSYLYGPGLNQEKKLVISLNNESVKSIEDFLLPWNRRGDVYEHVEKMEAIISLLMEELSAIVQVKDDLEDFRLFHRTFIVKKELENRTSHKVYISSYDEAVIIPDIGVTIRLSEDEFRDDRGPIFADTTSSDDFTNTNIYYRKNTNVEELIHRIFDKGDFVEKLNSYSYRTVTDIFKGRDILNKIHYRDMIRLFEIVVSEKNIEPYDLFDMYKAANPDEDLYELSYYCKTAPNRNGILSLIDSEIPSEPLLFTNKCVYYFDKDTEKIHCKPLTQDAYNKY